MHFTGNNQPHFEGEENIVKDVAYIWCANYVLSLYLVCTIAYFRYNRQTDGIFRYKFGERMKLRNGKSESLFCAQPFTESAISH